MSHGRSVRAPCDMRTSVLALVFVVGCTDPLGSRPGSGPDDRVAPVADPMSAPLAADAPFEPGARIDMGSADGAFDAMTHTLAQEAIFPGDLDGDGIDDLLVAGQIPSPADVVECSMGCAAFSQAYIDVIYGRANLGGELRRDARLLGWFVSGLRHHARPAGDVDGDGRADLLIGIATEGCEQGNAFLVYGGERLSGEIDVRDAGTLIRESGTCTRFGEVAGVGDLDADGFDDFAVGSLGEGGGEGRVFLFYGRAARFTERLRESDADAILVGPDVAELARADRAGDVNGDGHGDAFVHVRDNPLAPREGRLAWLVLGRAERFAGTVLLTRTAIRIDGEPWSYAALGDLDRDGRDDFAIANGDAARDAQIFLGRATWPSVIGPSDADAWVPGPEIAVSSGRTSIAGAGDVDGDGALDLLYGDSAHGDPEIPRGAVFLVHGGGRIWSGAIARDEATVFLGQHWLSASEADVLRGYDAVGSSIAGGSDLDADGFDDFAIPAPTAPVGGRVYLWLGRAGA